MTPPLLPSVTKASLSATFETTGVAFFFTPFLLSLRVRVRSGNSRGAASDSSTTTTPTDLRHINSLPICRRRFLATLEIPYLRLDTTARLFSVQRRPLPYSTVRGRSLLVRLDNALVLRRFRRLFTFIAFSCFAFLTSLAALALSSSRTYCACHLAALEAALLLRRCRRRQLRFLSSFLLLQFDGCSRRGLTSTVTSSSSAFGRASCRPSSR
jgi:hypothetical protein